MERKAFEEMLMKFESFKRQVEHLCRNNGERRMSRWLDNGDVCHLLDISPRTLQTLRDNGTLAFTKLGNRTYYLPEDVQRLVSRVMNRRSGTA